MFKLWPYLEGEEGGKPGAGGTGSGDDGKSGEEGAKPPDITQQVNLLTQAVGLLSQGHEGLKTTLESINTTLTGLQPKKDDPPRPSIDSIIKDLDEEGLDDKTKQQRLLSNIETLIADRVGEAVSKVTAQVDSLNATFQSSQAGAAVREMAGQNKDFFEWAPEMKALIAENPTLTVARAYALAKAENPTKLADMTKKYAPKTEGQRRTLSLMPSSTLRGEKPGKMSQKDAALDAFDRVMAQFEGNGLLGSDTQVI